MKGIYITEEGKKELEAKIAELEIIKLKLLQIRERYYEKNKDSEFLRQFMSSNSEAHSRIVFKIKFYKEILSSAIVVPVEESWTKVEIWTNMLDKYQIEFMYPNGLIIQPKP
jgi:hypothetical protein